MSEIPNEKSKRTLPPEMTKSTLPPENKKCDQKFFIHHLEIE